jgi:hypothetical protein
MLDILFGLLFWGMPMVLVGAAVFYLVRRRWIRVTVAVGFSVLELLFLAQALFAVAFGSGFGSGPRPNMEKLEIIWFGGWLLGLVFLLKLSWKGHAKFEPKFSPSKNPAFLSSLGRPLPEKQSVR